MEKLAARLQEILDSEGIEVVCSPEELIPPFGQRMDTMLFAIQERYPPPMIDMGFLITKIEGYTLVDGHHNGMRYPSNKR